MCPGIGVMNVISLDKLSWSMEHNIQLSYKKAPDFSTVQCGAIQLSD